MSIPWNRAERQAYRKTLLIVMFAEREGKVPKEPEKPCEAVYCRKEHSAQSHSKIIERRG